MDKNMKVNFLMAEWKVMVKNNGQTEIGLKVNSKIIYNMDLDNFTVQKQG